LENVVMSMSSTTNEVFAVAIPSKTYGQDIALIVGVSSNECSDKQRERIRSEIGSQVGALYKPALILFVGEGEDAWR
jgi:acyl-coenzyme A synthetase/AMP-(fatty) acid ligase